MSSEVKAALITGILGFIATISAAIISNGIGKSNAIHDVVSEVNTETSNINIRIDTKDDLINLLNELLSKSTEIATENGKLEYSNTELQKENNSLKNENTSLKNQLDEYTQLADENARLTEINASLEETNTSLEVERDQLQKELDELRGNVDPSPTPSTSSGKKVSIFDLDTFKGKPGWYNHSYYSNKDVFIDTYGTEYLTGYVGHHRSSDKNSSHSPTYLLDNNYSTCEGEIAWAKNDKNSKETAWIEFYSGDELIYKTEPITVDSRPFPFSFNVEGIEKLTIVRNATGSNSSWIIYPYLNLVE